MSKLKFIDARNFLAPGFPLAEIVRHLESGGVIIHPTETVYGFGGILDRDVTNKITCLKRRTLGKPMLLLVPDRKSIEALRWTPEALMLADAFWPGPLTIVLKKSDLIPEVTVSGLNTAGFRIPNHRVPINLCELTKSPLTATSANISGNLPATNAKMASDQFKNSRLDLILDDGETTLSVPSSIVDMSQPNERMIREGAISMERIKSILHRG